MVDFGDLICLRRSPKAGAIVLIHGLGSSHAVWSARVVEALSQYVDRSVYSFGYQTGFGASSACKPSYSEIAQSLRHKLKDAGLLGDALSLIGHSQGAIVALRYVVDYTPSHGVETLVLLGVPRLGSETADAICSIAESKVHNHVRSLHSMSADLLELSIGVHSTRGALPKTLNVLGTIDIHAPLSLGAIPYPFAVNVQVAASHSGLRRFHLHPDLASIVGNHINGVSVYSNVSGYDSPRSLLLQTPVLPVHDDRFSVVDIERALSVAFEYRQTLSTERNFEQWRVLPAVASRLLNGRQLFLISDVPAGLYQINLFAALGVVSSDEYAVQNFISDWLQSIDKAEFEVRIYHCGFHAVSLCDDSRDVRFDDLLPLSVLNGNYLAEAIAQRDFRLARQLIRAGWDINLPGKVGSTEPCQGEPVDRFMTPLMAAISSDDLDLPFELLEAGAKLDENLDVLENELSTAIREKRQNLVQCLLNHGAQLPRCTVELGIGLEKLLDSHFPGVTWDFPNGQPG